MSQIDYYGADPRSALPHEGGLVAWGVVMIVLGGLAALFGVFSLVFAIVVARKLIPGMAGQNPWTFIVGVATYAVAAAVLISLGIGSYRGRRWVRPLMIIASALTAGGGLISILTMGLGIVHYVLHPVVRPAATAALPFDPALIGFAFGGCFALLLMVALPLVLFWFYWRPSVQATLDVMDPNPRWTDRCPLPVLGWAIGCVFFGITFASMTIYGTVPFFNSVLTGAPADGVILCLAFALSAGGVLCYCQNPLGALMTVGAATVLAGSYTAFAFLGDHQKYFNVMFRMIPAAQRPVAQRFAENSLIGPAAMYVAAVVYAVWIRNRFGEKVAAPKFPA